ncbi:hypothetical protein, partial [Chryseobacterium binzhouense]|uniref:hypothetical protein n=1 Tax=Chryseobacterium binzhouense TaxID=2593646 RepID=UPI00289785A6
SFYSKPHTFVYEVFLCPFIPPFLFFLLPALFFLLLYSLLLLAYAVCYSILPSCSSCSKTVETRKRIKNLLKVLNQDLMKFKKLI